MRKVIGIGVVAILGCFWLGKESLAIDNQPDIMELTRKSGQAVTDFYRPKASIVISADTGQILWEEQPDLVRKIASMSKLMTIFVALEKLTPAELDRPLPVTQKYVDIANNYNLSNNKMQLGASYTPRELLDLIIVPSSNAATVMLADSVTKGDDAAFVQLMNETAQAIGMKNSKFYNCAGAVNNDFGVYQPKGIDPNGDNDSTPRDMALLVFHLLKKHPFILEHTKQTKVTVKAGTPYEETFETYLNSLPGTRYGYDGVDGLKTGSSPSAAFNYAATAKKGEMRVIEIIMGVGNWDHQECEYMRHPIGNAVLDYVFENFSQQQLLAKGVQTIAGKKVTVEKDLQGVVQKEHTPEFRLTEGQVVVANALPLVAPNFPQLAVPMKIIPRKTEAKITEQAPTIKQRQKQTRQVKWAIAILIVLVALLVGTLILYNRSRKRHR